MSALDEHLKRHRKKIINREEKTFREMLGAYAEIEKELKKSFDDLQKQIEKAQANGETINPSWFFRENRFKNLLAQVQEQIIRFGGAAAKIIEREQQAAIRIAVSQAEENFKFQISNSIEGGAPDAANFAAGLNTRAVETAVGVMGDGSPILSYFEQNLAPLVAEKIKSEVIKASAAGTDFKTISKRLTDTGGITKHRALSVARTETNRVRREAARQIYQENADIIQGWEWVASKSRRTCPVCLAMDGRIFKLKEKFPQHPNCRCQLIAVIENLPRRPRTIGSEWFDAQPDEIKKEILGKESFLAYQNGDAALNDFVGWKNDKRFGRSVYRKPLAQILADKGILRESNRAMKAGKLTKELLQTAKLNEPLITKELRQIAAPARAHLVGLENRFKSEESLTRKLLDYSESSGLPLKAMAKSNNDTLRYTYLLSENSYLEGFERIIEELKKRNYRIGKVFNAWELAGKKTDTGYRGINITVISSQKQKFELQLHTRDSFDLKTETHKIYEELRNPKTSADRKRKIIDELIENAKRLKTPKGL